MCWLSNLLKKGQEAGGIPEAPPPPVDKIRILPTGLLDELLVAKYGDKLKYAAKHYSDGDYLVTSDEEMARYISFFEKKWLPKLKPYTIRKYKKLDGTEVDVYIRNCDDFSDGFQGIISLYLEWCGYPWGQIWAMVPEGGHAFQDFVSCDVNTYDEKGINGLKLSTLEPQTAEFWPARRHDSPLAKIAVVDAYEVGQIYMVKF